MANREYSLGSVRVEETTVPHAGDGVSPEPVGDELVQRTTGGGQFSGRCKRIALRQGFDLSLFDIEAAEAFTSGGVTTAPHLSVSVLLEAEGEGWTGAQEQAAASGTFQYRSGMTYIAFVQEAMPGSYRLPAGSRFRVAEVRVTLDFLARLGVLPRFLAADAGHPLCKFASERCWIGLMRTPPLVDADARAVIDLGFAEESSPLELESRALRILARTIEAVSAAPPSTGPDHAAARRDERRLVEARQRLDAAPARAWTIRALAREVGLNEKKLKQGFRRQFGDTVHGYLTAARMAEARRLLASGDLSVTDVCLKIGYANPSHFALQFRRAHGVTPRQALRATGSGHAEDVPVAG